MQICWKFSFGDFILIANNKTYKGLCVAASLYGTIKYNINAFNKLEETVSKTNEYLDSFVGRESWIKVQGNNLDSLDYLLTGASFDSNKITMQSTNSRVVLNYEYWSDRREHRIILAPMSWIYRYKYVSRYFKYALFRYDCNWILDKSF